MVALGILLHFGVACLLAAAVNWLGLGAWRQAATAHWTERARLLWPVRVTAGRNGYVIPLLLFLVQAMRGHPTALATVAEALAAWAGAILGGYPLSREIFPTLTFRRWAGQTLASWGVFSVIWFMAFTAIMIMPERPGCGMVLVAGGYLGFHALLMGGMVYRWLRWVKILVPAGPRLQNLMTGLAARQGVPVRAIWEMDTVVANALALPLTSELIFTTGLLAVATDAEIEAIGGHELAHLAEPKGVMAGRVLGSLAIFPLLFVRPAFENFSVAGIFMLLLGTWLVTLFARQLSQRMEKRADRMAVTGQTQPGLYARALEKLYQVNQAPAVSYGNQQKHPHLYDRLLAAGVTPDYPRPASPRKLTWAGRLLLGTTLAAAIWVAVIWLG